MNQTLELGNKDAGLTIINYPGELPWLSGGIPVNPKWQPVEGRPNLYRATLPEVEHVPGLNKVEYTDPLHARMTRARHPNRVVSGGTMEHGLIGTQNTSWQKPPGWGKPGFELARTVFLDEPVSGGHAGGPQHYTYGSWHSPPQLSARGRCRRLVLQPLQTGRWLLVQQPVEWRRCLCC